MEDISELLWDASTEEIKQGYVYNGSSEEYICLVCGKGFTRGIVYQDENIFYDAEKYTRVHIKKEHSSMFEYLLNMDRRLTGLTDLQKSLLNYFHKGYSDIEIVNRFDGGSTSTIRNHRFALKQREKQSKIFLTIMELLEEEKSVKKVGFMSIHKTATVVDERYDITEKEKDEILNSYFKDGLDGPLKDFPKKEKRKIVILRNIAMRFESEKEYTEKEVNEVLKGIFHDFVTIRRYLIEYGFMDRHKDGSSYWIKK